jgi:hypothetical protein
LKSAVKVQIALVQLLLMLLLPNQGTGSSELPH